MSFGETLQEVRRRSGLTQEQFAEELAVSRQAVSKWESGRGYPEVEKILYICNRYGITPNELFSEEVPLAAVALQPEYVEAPSQPEKVPPRPVQAGKKAWLVLGLVAGTLISLVIGAILKGGNADMIPLIWVGVMVIFGALEAITVGLTSIWFMVGGIGGLVVSMLNGPIWLQLLVFFVVSIGCMIAARPLVVKYVNQSAVATNADRVLGAVARVTEAIDNAVPVGAVYVDGKTWSARSVSGEPVAVGAMVRVKRMEGVRLFVEEVKEEA